MNIESGCQAPSFCQAPSWKVARDLLLRNLMVALKRHGTAIARGGRADCSKTTGTNLLRGCSLKRSHPHLLHING